MVGGGWGVGFVVGEEWGVGFVMKDERGFAIVMEDERRFTIVMEDERVFRRGGGTTNGRFAQLAEEVDVVEWDAT